eukprot:gene38684-47029_t
MPGNNVKLPFTLPTSPPTLQPPKDFKIPEPKPMSVADGDYSGVYAASLGSAIRLGSGAFVIGWTPFCPSSGPWPGTLNVLRDGSSLLASCARPASPPVIYEYEASPYCRKVREAVAMLDLTVEYRPCPGARQGWSDEQARVTGGRRTVPYLQDGDTGLFESDDIINYLFDKYGPGRGYVPFMLKGDFAVRTCAYAAQLRKYAGSRLLRNARGDMSSMQPVVLWGYEASPFVKPVRETLSALGLRHVMVSCARGSSNRDALFALTGRFQVPYLQDPNTGVQMFESSAIVKYLLDVYTV